MRRRPLCISVWTNVEDEATVESTIESLHASEQVQFLLYVAKPDHIYYYDFPVNYLRNLCIRHIKTSHFMFLDFDMWPTGGFGLPRSRRDASRASPRAAAGVAGGPHGGGGHSARLPEVGSRDASLSLAGELLHEVVVFSQMESRSREMAPENVQELLECKEKGVCLFTKEGGYAHMLVQKELFSVTDSLVTEIACFPWRLQEPSGRWRTVT